MSGGPSQDPHSDTEPIGTAALLTLIVSFLKRFIVFASDLQVIALALWVLHTHALKAAEATPYMLILSPEKRTGKSRLLELLSLLVARAWLAVSPTEAVLFRKIDADRPTLLLDEADALFDASKERTEPIRAVLNSGYRRGSTVPRCFRAGQNWAVQNFAVFCPKAIAGIDTGKVPETVRDRSVLIRIERKTGAESVERFRYRDVKIAGLALLGLIKEWATPNVEALRTIEPPLYDELNDRAMEVWEPLLAIAELAGGEWPELARLAALELSGEVDVEDESFGTRLLADAEIVWAEYDHDAMFTSHLLSGLKKLEESPWGSYGSKRKEPGLTARDLSRILRPYGIRPRTVRVPGSHTGKGYKREDFVEPWRRYLPADRPRIVRTDEGLTREDPPDLE